MIYVTVGGHYQDFSRLVSAVDGIAPKFEERFFIQRGASRCVPRNAEHVDYLDFDTAERYIKEASVVISHAGIGTLLSARRYGRPIIVVPRRSQLREHQNDHQFDICEMLLQEKRGGVSVVYDVDRLEETLKGVLTARQAQDGAAPDTSNKLIEEILSFIGK